MIGVAQAAAIAQIRIIDYQRSEATGVLISSGCGIMMAVMDCVPTLRWCVDIDSQPKGAGLEFFCRLIDGEIGPVGVAGWFSLTNPTELRRAIASMTAAPLVYTQPGLGAGISCPNLDTFIASLSRARTFAQPVTTSVRRATFGR